MSIRTRRIITIISLIGIIFCTLSIVKNNANLRAKHEDTMNKLNEVTTENVELKAEIEDIKIKHEEELNQYKREYNETSRSSYVKRETQTNTGEGTYLGWFSSAGYCTEDWRGTGKVHYCNSGTPNIGAMGEEVTPYKTIAVDPNVIPLGSQLKIQDENGNVYYVRANDTGGAIKGNKIDMVCGSHNEALAWGRRKVQIWKLESGG